MRRMIQEAACASDLMLDEWGAGELDREASASLAAHVDGCARCRARHASFEAARAAFLEEAPSFRAHAERPSRTFPCCTGFRGRACR